MESEPDTTNVFYIDEYPELQKRCWLRRLNEMRRIGRISIAEGPADIIEFPSTDPDDAA